MRKVGAAALFFFGALAIAVGAASRVLAVVFDEIRSGLAQGAESLYKQAEVLEREPAGAPGVGEQMAVGSGSVADFDRPRLVTKPRHLDWIEEKLFGRKPGERIREVQP